MITVLSAIILSPCYLVNGGIMMKKSRALFWVLPSICLMAVMIAVPIITVFKLSVSDISRTGLIKGFIGLSNFQTIFSDPVFWKSLSNTLVWTVCVVGLSTLIGLTLALVLNVKFKGRKIVRTVLLIPWATALNIQAMAWKYILNADYGALNVLLKKLGFIKSNIAWLADAGSTFAWECWIGIFVTVPFVAFTLLAGLQNIDEQYYQAADVDGANFRQTLCNVTLPLLRPNIAVSTVLNIIYVFNSFPIVWIISKGSPADQTHLLVTYLYKLAFYSGKTGEAAAVSVIGFILLSIASSIYMVMTMREEKFEKVNTNHDF